ncbi:polymorphic toxin-type HINT domain-containing protein [Streptomyces sp. WG7]|uniref:polymorphic toxin-type HINT domain-containing protein n=1 Tax=Streptomyces sp. WG7 TaxID=3417650 RepID=UPI003CF32E26
MAKSVADGQAIEDDIKALAAELAKPDADKTAIAEQGREIALRAMEYYGSWRKEAAAQALGGSDGDVLEYLRAGWQAGVADEMRQQVADLSTTSPYDKVRTAAVEALKGTDEQVRDFYLTGRHEAAESDYRAEISKIYNTDGTSTKEKAKAALLDGSIPALRTFLNRTQYSARNTDERAAASKLFNDGGPEVKAAAKIALNAPADELHTFIQAGQYMADRKDQLAYTHIAQVDRLIAEGEMIATKAREDAHRAAQAAYVANNTAADAERSRLAAEASAKEAAGHATQADQAADRAESSAAQAKESATTARNAADRARQDAVNAEESAADAAFSASYARASAETARKSADDAHQAALDAGKSADEAEADAKAAWDDVVTKREAELAEERRLAAEQRKAEREKEKKPKCFINIYRDTLPPCMMSGGEIVIPKVDEVATEIFWELTGLNDIKRCVTDPTLSDCLWATVSVLPAGKIKSVKSLDKIKDIIEKSRAGRAIKCATCFLAGTKVLMADGSRKNIESIRPGETVTATDPDTGQTQAHVVEDLIVTDQDQSFSELTISTSHGFETLTATHEHPFWSPSRAEWVEAGDLQPGTTLRTLNGAPATVQENRPFIDQARTYNLTVEVLHTFYVLAGDTPILVHNDVCGVRVSPMAPDWATKGAHLHVGADEVRVFGDEVGGIGAKPLRMSHGWASNKSVQKVLDTLKSSPELRKDLIQKARAAQTEMNKHNWGNAKNRALELQYLIKALEKLG